MAAALCTPAEMEFVAVSESRPRRRMLKLRCGAMMMLTKSAAEAALRCARAHTSRVALALARSCMRRAAVSLTTVSNTHPPAPIRNKQTNKPGRSLEVSLVVHTLSFAWFARVWLWHLTPAASGLPGAHGFGWFLRFLTFYSYTLQTIALGVATADDWCKLVRASGRA